MAANLRKRRGVVRASITRLSGRITELEGTPDQPRTTDHARQLLTRLQTLDANYRVLHLQIVDLIDEGNEEALDVEQGHIDKLEDDVSYMTVRLQGLMAPVADTAPAAKPPDRRPLTRQLARVQSGLNSIGASTETDEPIAPTLLSHFSDELFDYKRDLATIYSDLATEDISDDDELFTTHSTVERQLSTLSHKIKSLLAVPLTNAPVRPTADGAGVKLPKLDVPVFDGNIIHWRQFWDQFTVAVHSKKSLSNAEKTVYLQQAVKDGSARNAIEGLSHSGDNYEESIECLKSRYDRPRLIQRTHVQLILDTPPLKEGSGKDLRRLHDVVQQHVRALKTLGCDLPGRFITSMIELKLDANTLFEWQKHTQTETEVPHYQDLLDFIDLRAQASEVSCTSLKKPTPSPRKPPSRFAAHTATQEASDNCPVCTAEKHPLYTCSKFKSMPQEDKLQAVRSNRLCSNCLGSGHFKSQCKSVHKCKVCQKLHHTLLHSNAAKTQDQPPNQSDTQATTPVGSHTVSRVKSDILLMTSRVLITAPDGSTVEARALLDNASSASFISERLANSLSLPRASQSIRVSGIGGMSHKPPLQAVTQFQLSSVKRNGRKIEVTAIIVPKITCDLPMSPITFQMGWTHLSDLALADPEFTQPGRIDILLGADVYVNVLRQGRRDGPPNSPTAFETDLGWVLCGSTESTSFPVQANVHVTAFHTPVMLCDDVLRKFWELEEAPSEQVCQSAEERMVVRHFDSNHSRSEEGRFIVPLPKNPEARTLGESRSQAVRRFLSLERSLNQKGCFQQFDAVMQEYLDLGHAEAVPTQEMDKPPELTFYLPMHAVYKTSSTTTKIRAVFDASAKSSTGVSLNDTLLVGPTLHPPLVDVLLRFRIHPVALTADISKMYRAVELMESDKDLHRFVWRSQPNKSLKDYRMTRATFGVSASSFAANMAVKQNAIDHADEFPVASEVVHKSFYVDDCLTGSQDSTSALLLQQQLTKLFSLGGFVLRKWKSNDPSVLQKIPEDLRDSCDVHTFTEDNNYSKTLGIEWNVTSDQLRLNISKHPGIGKMTKRSIVSDVAKVFDALGFFSPATVKMKILLQRLWETKLDWDDPVPEDLLEVWMQWRNELPSLSEIHITRCYSPSGFSVSVVQLHGFCDASEEAYGGVVYLRLTNSSGNVHTEIVMAKTKVSPIKRLSIPRLELCGAQLLTKLLCHVKRILNVAASSVFAWTDSTIVLTWLTGNPRRFKTYVGNRVSFIIDQLPPDCWRHVAGSENPADCASRGLFPRQLKDHESWWKGPLWLQLDSSQWPAQPNSLSHTVPDEEREICHLTAIAPLDPIIPVARHSSFNKLKRITAWIFRFVKNLRSSTSQRCLLPNLLVTELSSAENYWLMVTQRENFTSEYNALKKGQVISKGSRLLSFRPIWDQRNSLMRVGGRLSNSSLSYAQQHPVILDGKHPITKLIILSEHLRLMHAGPTLLLSNLSQRFHIIKARTVIRSITRQCIICKRHSIHPQAQLLGQFPTERVSVAAPFERTGVDYAGPFQIKYGYVRKPTLIKAYVCLFVCLAIKAVHLEVVSDLTTEAFIAVLRRFIARRGCPSLIWSDHGSNFVGAKSELKELQSLLADPGTQNSISDFCSTNNIQWKFIPERAPHFGGIWESAVKCVKTHLKRIVSPVRLTFEEFSTVLSQIEACLNSRPLSPMNSPDDDGITVLTPGHFLIGKPLTALPDSQLSYRSISLLKHWHLCQQLVRHFWERWQNEYLHTINRYNKWHFPSRNVAVGDIVILQETGTIPTKWPIARVIAVHPGLDGLVRVVTIKTPQGTYKRPVTKIAVLLPNEN